MQAEARTSLYVIHKSSQQSYTRRAWLRFRRNRMALISSVILCILALAAILARVLAPYDPTAIDLRQAGLLQAPDFSHLFGTDELGRDAFSRALFGARISLPARLRARLEELTSGPYV